MASRRDSDPVAELLRRLEQPVAPPAAFADSLRRQLLSELHPDRQSRPKGGTVQNLGLGVDANGRAPSSTLPWPAPQRAPRHQWWSALELIAAAGLVLVLAGGSLLGPGLLPTLVGLWQDDEAPSLAVGVPMLGANPARTNEQPGPGPSGEPSLRWRTYVDLGATSPVVAGGVIYVAGHIGSVVAVDGATGAEIWRTPLGALASAPTVVDGRVYVGVVFDTESANSEGFVYAFAAATGSELWRASTGSFNGASPAVVGDTVYAAGDNELYAFDATAGRQRWRLDFDGLPCQCTPADPAVAEGLVYVVGGGDFTTLYAVDAATGRQRWRFDTNGPSLTSPVVADGLVYVGGGAATNRASVAGGGRFYAVDAATGTQRWSAEIGVSGPPAVAAGTVYVPVGDAFIPNTENVRPTGAAGGVLALEAATGAERWTATLPGPAATAPAIADGMVYVAGGWESGYVAAIDGATGRQEWQLPLRGSVAASPAVVDGALYVTTYHTGALFALGQTADAPGTPGATPSTGGTALGGEPYAAEPRPDALEDLTGTPSAGIGDGFGLVGVPFPREEQLPRGPSAPAEDIAGITRAVEAFARCGDADPDRRASFYSDDFFRRFLQTEEWEPTTTDAVMAGGVEISPFAEVTVRDARVLPDGRIGAIIEGAPNLYFLVFVPEGGRWLIDEVVYVDTRPPYLGTPRAGTP